MNIGGGDQGPDAATPGSNKDSLAGGPTVIEIDMNESKASDRNRKLKSVYMNDQKASPKNNYYNNIFSANGPSNQQQIKHLTGEQANSKPKKLFDISAELSNSPFLVPEVPI